MNMVTLIFSLMINFGFSQTSSPPLIPVPPKSNLENQLPPSELDQKLNMNPSDNSTSQTIELVEEGEAENLSPNSNNQLSNQSLSWDPTGKRDPFKPYRAPRAVKQNSDVFIDPLTLLDLSQVQVVAILWNNKNPRAVIRGSGKLFTIFKKTNIGSNNGVVAEIREGEVIVVETFDDGFGNIVKEIKPLRLSKPNSGPNSVSSGS